MNQGKKPISHNIEEREDNAEDVSSKSKAAGEQVVKFDDFAVQKVSAQPHIQNLVKLIARETNRHKLTYLQLKYIFRLVRERCQIEVPYTHGRRLRELPTTEEMARFYGVMENPIHRLLFETLQGTGMRVSELCNLEVRRLDFKTNLIFISQAKGKKDRVTVMGNRLKEKLQIYLEGRTNRFLFETSRHTKFSTRRIEQICQKYKAQAGIEKELTPHTLRHLFCSALAQAGLNEERRAIIMGHEDQATQKIYTHLAASGFKDEIIELLDKV